MNIAYSCYLQNALEHSTLTDEEKQGAHLSHEIWDKWRQRTA